MKYDSRPNYHNRVQVWGGSCAFRFAYGRFISNRILLRQAGFSVREMRTRMWEHLCMILTASEERSVILVTTDQEEEWRDLLHACPYAKMVEETKSQHGPYNVQLWVVPKHKRNSE